MSFLNSARTTLTKGPKRTRHRSQSVTLGIVSRDPIMYSAGVAWRDSRQTFRSRWLSLPTALTDVTRVNDSAVFPTQVHAFLRPPVQGVVLQTYGAGNAPTARLDIMDEIRSANERGVLLLNCSQCPQGAVDPAYETGNALLEAGVIPGSDMTPEAALTKLSYVLSKTEWTHETKKKMLQKNLRGELTVSGPNTKTGQ
ncbi:unnamed protein product [Ixodes pacificus]